MSAGDLEALLARASAARPGAEKVRALSAAAEWLEDDGQLERAFDFKLQIAHLADQAGMRDRALEVFSWCRAKTREQPRRFAPEILPTFERLIPAMIGEIAWPELEPLLDDFERAARDAGTSLYRVYWQRQVVAWFRGDEAEADRFAARMRRECSPPGNCRLCDLDFEIRRTAERGDHREALAMAEPILLGDRSCSRVPRCTYQALLYPLLAQGRKDEAERAYQTGYALARQARRHAPEFGPYLRYLALVEAWEEGARLLERHLAPRAAFASERDAFAVYEGAWILCEKLRARASHLTLRLDKRIPVARDGQRGFETRALSEWLAAELGDIARRFDANNQTDRFARLLERARRFVAESYAPRAKPSDPRR